MKKTKNTYLSPVTEILVVRFEGALLQASIRSFSCQGTENLDYDDNEEDL